MPIAYINIGSNMGDCLAQIEQAVTHIEYICQSVVRRAPLIKSQPWGFESDMEFVNLGIALETDMEPLELLHILQKVERAISPAPHRNEKGEYLDREIDIDIIAIDDIVLNTPELVLPHPRMHLREFVLAPLEFLAPEWLHPVLKQTPAQMLKSMTI